jgi:hypothetical protein
MESGMKISRAGVRPGKGPQGTLRGPRKGPRKEGTQERAVKAKEGVVC